MANISEALAQAKAYHRAGQLDRAATIYRHILQLDVANAQAYYFLGAACNASGNLSEAVANLRQAVRLAPDYPDAHNQLGVALARQGKMDEAIASFEHALRLQPAFPETQRNLRSALACAGAAAAKGGAPIREAARESAEKLNRQGIAMAKQGKLGDAIILFERAVQIDPDYAWAPNSLGNALRLQGRFEEATACYQRALQAKADCIDAHWNLSLTQLLRGDFRRGWQEYEWRWKFAQKPFTPRHFRQPMWDGQPLAGKTILLHAEQGIGDTL